MGKFKYRMFIRNIKEFWRILLKIIMELHLYKKASTFLKDNTLKYFKVKGVSAFIFLIL